MFTELFLMVVPGILAGEQYRKITKSNWSWNRCLEIYAFFSYLIFFLNNTIIYFRGWNILLSQISLQGVIKYIVLTFIWIYFLPKLIVFIKKVE